MLWFCLLGFLKLSFSFFMLCQWDRIVNVGLDCDGLFCFFLFMFYSQCDLTITVFRVVVWGLWDKWHMTCDLEFRGSFLSQVTLFTWWRVFTWSLWMLRESTKLERIWWFLPLHVHSEVLSVEWKSFASESEAFRFCAYCIEQVFLKGDQLSELFLLCACILVTRNCIGNSKNCSILRTKQ